LLRLRYNPLPMKLVAFACVIFGFASAMAQSAPSEVQSVLPDAKALYLDLHEHPELSSHETQTAAKLAGKLRALGYDVTEHIGGTGIAAVMKNGSGPTVMLRT